MNIGERIKMRRESLGMSQQELAEKIGYTSRSTINKIEDGTNNLRQTKIAQIAKALNVTPAYLMGWEDNLETADTDILVDIATNDRMQNFLSEFYQLNQEHQDHIIAFTSFLLKQEKGS